MDEPKVEFTQLGCSMHWAIEHSGVFFLQGSPKPNNFRNQEGPMELGGKWPWKAHGRRTALQSKAGGHFL